MALLSYTTSPPPQRRVFGDCVMRIWQGVNGASGDTINTGMQDILAVWYQPFLPAGTASLITGITQTASAVSVSPGGSILTITSSGPMVNETIIVLARVG